MNPTDFALPRENPDLQPKNGFLHKRRDVLAAISSSINLLQEFKNFKSSSDPSRFLYFENGSWFDFAREVFDELRDGFLHGKSTLEVSIGGNSYVFDFLRMVKVDVESGASNSIAWIDATGKCFFPRVALDDSAGQKSDVEVSDEEISDPLSNSNSKKRKRDRDDDSFEECTDESPDVSSSTTCSHINKNCNYDTLQGPRWKNVHKVEKEDRFYRVVERLFLTGMARSSVVQSPVEVTAVHKCKQEGPAGSRRMKAFQLLVQEMKSLRAENCVQFGWYGANLNDLKSALEFGFGTTNSSLLGSKSHGVGVHLTSPHFPCDSAMMAQEDENGERHVLLCRVIMGQAEQVEEGSSQAQPSTGEYDSGVDNLNNPKWYIVWGTHMNTHILPEYLVSFKINKPNKAYPKINVEGMKKPTIAASPKVKVEGVKKPIVATTSNNLQYHFPKMISEMKQSLNPSRIHALQYSYNRWQEGKMSKDAFIRFLRTVAGDKLLVTIIRKIRGY
ncbi:Poly [ADP-ribose] polymerase [Rhynchospora pubera]|uniref:Poly [ADP-ribose] polymerase n=1 Tax=Rhynchospora pubera TaxID=906938 RepID=A0AAV8DHB9_9POAL|nr:Poly [ADP-ribose] polymerase [Rhynchospora pubera]